MYAGGQLHTTAALPLREKALVLVSIGQEAVVVPWRYGDETNLLALP